MATFCELAGLTRQVHDERLCTTISVDIPTSHPEHVLIAISSGNEYAQIQLDDAQVDLLITALTHARNRNFTEAR